jgi:hypothetical protein
MRSTSEEPTPRPMEQLMDQWTTDPGGQLDAVHNPQSLGDAEQAIRLLYEHAQVVAGSGTVKKASSTALFSP